MFRKYLLCVITSLQRIAIKEEQSKFVSKTVRYLVQVNIGKQRSG
jgi:hypothetical protein